MTNLENVSDRDRELLTELIDFDPSSLAYDKGEMIMFQIISLKYEIALHWYVKLQWNSRHKIPFNKGLRNLYKKKGEVLVALSELVKQVSFAYGNFVVLDGYSCKICSSFEWFCALVMEMERRDLFGLRATSEKSNKTYDKRPKQRTYARERAYISQLSNISSDPDDVPIKFEASALFYKRCHELANKSDLFRRNYWNPYISALRAELSHEHSDQPVGFACGDRVKVQGEGRGRQTRSIQEPLWEPDKKIEFQKPDGVRTSGFITRPALKAKNIDILQGD